MSGAHIPTRPTFWGILPRLIRLSVFAKAENMFLKFSPYKCVIKRSCFGGTFYLCSANDNRTSDGHYLHLNQLAQQVNRIGKCYFVHLLMCCGECYRLLAQGSL